MPIFLKQPDRDGIADLESVKPAARHELKLIEENVAGRPQLTREIVAFTDLPGDRIAAPSVNLGNWIAIKPR